MGIRVAHQVHVHIDQTRQNGRVAQIDDIGIRGNVDRAGAAGSFDSVAAHDDCSIRQHAAVGHVQESAGFDIGYLLGGGKLATDQETDRKDQIPCLASHGILPLFFRTLLTLVIARIRSRRDHR